MADAFPGGRDRASRHRRLGGVTAIGTVRGGDQIWEKGPPRGTGFGTLPDSP
jgi:hypothetical protein